MFNACIDVLDIDEWDQCRSFALHHNIRNEVRANRDRVWSGGVGRGQVG